MERKTNEEIKQEKRRKQMAIIKASNEMLLQAKNTVMNTDKLNDFDKTERINEIDQAIEQNKMKAMTYLQASEEEVNSMIYGEASEEEKEKYKKRLEKLGKTEDDISRMTSAVIVNEQETKKKSKRQHPTKRKSSEVLNNNGNGTESITRLPNEDELMKKSLATEERIRIRMGENTKQNDKLEEEIEKKLEEKKIKVVRKNKKTENNKENETKKEEKSFEKIKLPVEYDFDLSDVPSYVQYDILPLPSEGKCYPIDSPLRYGRVPVAYLTASDENIIASPNLFRDGRINDVILKRKILDKRIDIKDLVEGDREAILMWLRSTGYGTGYPIVTTCPFNDKKYEVTVDLSKLKYKDFLLDSDDDGNFEFVSKNGDIIKFNYFTYQMREEYMRKILGENVEIEKVDINRYLNNIEDCLLDMKNINEDDYDDIKGCIDDIRNIINEDVNEDVDEDNLYYNTITEEMILHTKSVNGNDDINFIRTYIENMRSYEALEYRQYIGMNEPGINNEIKIEVPESDGGGSYSTFLRFGLYVFRNI